LMNCSGGDATSGWDLVNYAMLPPLLITIFALLLLMKFERKKAAQA
jgi:hypothetical protein